MATMEDLPEEVLVRILTYCLGRDLLNASEAFGAGSRVEQVVSRSALWREATIGPGRLRAFTRYLGPHTTGLTVLGEAKVAKGDQLSPAVIESVRLRCPALASLTLRSCRLDVTRVRLSLFPRSLTSLHLHSVRLLSLPQGERLSLASSPFLNIKKHLPLLQSLTLTSPSYLQPADPAAIVSGCQHWPELAITGEQHCYTFGRGEELGRAGRRAAGRHFRALIDFHFTKRSYGTRAQPPAV
jgi:hypothetical protein